MLVVCGAGLWRGGRYERIAAIVVMAAWVASVAVYRNGLHTEWGLFAVDALAFAGLTWVALKSHRYWPLWVAGFQLLTIVTHIASIVDHSLSPWAYVSAGIIWATFCSWPWAWRLRSLAPPPRR
jgi:hypothetical protein